jgi:hypothetical protein
MPPVGGSFVDGVIIIQRPVLLATVLAEGLGNVFQYLTFL